MRYFGDEPAFWLYAMEEEGDLPTHQGKINKFIKELAAQGPAANDLAVQEACLAAAGLTTNDLRPQDLEYIEQALNR